MFEGRGGVCVSVRLQALSKEKKKCEVGWACGTEIPDCPLQIQ
jgi:hypothetical protein